MADKKQNKTKQKLQQWYAEPHHRAGPVWRSLPLHTSPRPALAEYVHSSCVQQNVSHSSTCVGTEFVPVPCRDVGQRNMYIVLVPRYSSAGITAVYVQQDVGGYMLSLSQVSVVLGFPLFTVVRHPGERSIRPREDLSTPPARRVGHRSLFFRRLVIGRLCGTGVAPQRGRGRPSGGLDSQLFFGCVLTKLFSNIQITTTSQAYHTIHNKDTIPDCCCCSSRITLLAPCPPPALSLPFITLPCAAAVARLLHQD